jgi:hypothetical protein
MALVTAGVTTMRGERLMGRTRGRITRLAVGG